MNALDELEVTEDNTAKWPGLENDLIPLEAGAGLSLQLPEPNNNIEFSHVDREGPSIIIDCERGTVKLGEGIEIDDASELFWTVLADQSPKHLLAQMEEMEETIADLLTYKALWDQNTEAKNKLAKIATELVGVQPMSDRSDYDRAMKVVE